MNDRGRLRRVSIVLVVFGLVSFFNLLRRHGLDAMRTVDVVQLLGTGMLFGAALVNVVPLLRRPSA